MEVNASDTRNKSDSKITAGIGGKLANAIKELATNTAIGKDASGKRKKVSSHHISVWNANPAFGFRCHALIGHVGYCITCRHSKLADCKSRSSFPTASFIVVTINLNTLGVCSRHVSCCKQ